MSFCQYFFGKSIEQIIFEDISNLILDQTDLEKTHLECKSWKGRDRKDFREEVPEIVAFLNTDGGLLILGTPEEQRLDPNDPLKGKVLRKPFYFHHYITRDHLRDILVSPIEPLPVGIRIETIKKDNQDDQCITLVDIPKSEYPPHQVKGTYFVRLEGSTRRAPHIYVEALFNRRRPKYQQAFIEHFHQKLNRYRNNRQVMTALYYLTLEPRSVPEPVLLGTVIRGYQDAESLVGVQMLKRELEELADQTGIIVSKKIEGFN